MAEYIPATILIGGQLASDQLPKLFAAVQEDGVLDADHGGIGDRGELEALIDGARPLLLVHPDASYGKLPALEAACESLGLTYRRESDAKYEYEAEIVSWAPGMAEPRWTQGSQGGAAVIAIAAVRRLLDTPAASDAEVIARVGEMLAGYAPVEVPPLVLVATQGTARGLGSST